jgi:hypothetical protein
LRQVESPKVLPILQSARLHSLSSMTPSATILIADDDELSAALKRLLAT